MPVARTCSATTTGVRPTNQDRVCVEESRLAGELAVVVAVADGMGGLKEGDLAAEIAVSTVRRYAREVFPESEDVEALRAAVGDLFQEVNRSIWEHGQSRGHAGSVGTTLVFLIASRDRFVVGNVGDSRCYYVNNGGVRQVTVDHSQVQQMVRVGAMTPEQAQSSPYRGHLTNSLGEPRDVPVDLFPEDGRWGVIDEDCAFLLSSDGLHDSLTNEQLLAHLQGTPDLRTACSNLLSLAFRNGSQDNISIASAEFGKLARVSAPQHPLPPVNDLIKKGPAESRRPVQVKRAPAPWIVALVVVGFLVVLGLLLDSGRRPPGSSLPPGKTASPGRAGAVSGKEIRSIPRRGAVVPPPSAAPEPSVSASPKTTLPTNRERSRLVDPQSSQTRPATRSGVDLMLRNGQDQPEEGDGSRELYQK